MVLSVVLVPGVCSVGSVFNAPLKAELENLGYNDVVLIDSPSVDSAERLAQLQPNPLEADINHTKLIIESLVDEEKDVLVVGHSYGGTLVLYASEGLWKHSRKANTGGVIKAILLSSSLPLPGESTSGKRFTWMAEHLPELAKAQESPHVEMIDDVRYLDRITDALLTKIEKTPVLYPDGLEKTFFADMTADQQKLWATRGLRPTPLSTLLTETSQVTVADWRIAFLITTELDPSMPEAFQQYLIDDAKSNGAAIEEVKRLRSGHFVQVTHAVDVAEWIKEVSI